MEANNRASRRLYHLARHVGPNLEDHASGSISLLACNARGWDGFQRRDNRTLFARQSSENHGQFMRQAPVKQELPIGDDQRDVASKTALQLGPDSISKVGSSSSSSSTKEAPNYIRGPSFAATEPLFAKPAVETNSIEKLMSEIPARDQEPEPNFAKPNQESESESSGRSSSSGEAGQPTATGAEKQKDEGPGSAKDRIPCECGTQSDCLGFEWFPRMDVVESGTAYVITVELPGVTADGIHVEVLRGSLIVTGSRATDWWKEKNNGNGTVYHRRELAQGPYRAVWLLPKNGDINGITAEFIDGFLRVLVPKIKVMTYL